MRKAVTIAIFCGLSLFGVKAFACFCLRQPNSERVTKKELKEYRIFVATVLRKTGGKQATPGEKPNVSRLASKEQLVLLRVDESFNDLPVGSEVEVHSPPNVGGDCGCSFEIGKQYLIEAYDHQEKLSTDICTRTAPVSQVADVIREIRELHKPARKP